MGQWREYENGGGVGRDAGGGDRTPIRKHVRTGSYTSAGRVATGAHRASVTVLAADMVAAPHVRLANACVGTSARLGSARRGDDEQASTRC